jgi:O-antigen ligase
MDDNLNNRGAATLANVFLNFFKPNGSFAVFVATIINIMYGTSTIDPFVVAGYLLYFTLIISLIYLNIALLPRVFRLILTWSVTVIVSLLSMSWCINYEQKCSTYFVYTEEKAELLVDTFRTAVIRIFNITLDEDHQ